MKIEGAKLGNKNLEDWLKNPPKKALQKGDDRPYAGKYSTLKHELKSKHHETTKAAILKDIEEKIKKARKNGETFFDLEKIMWLNDHGPDHIQTVIDRASDLLENEDIRLNAREVYLLLNSIQLHDIGNFLGRTNHEKVITQVIRKQIPLVAFDDFEKNYVVQVAQVHGGKLHGKNGSESKNTIKGLIGAESQKLGQYDVDLRFLAAVLRFADELADDNSRADAELLRAGKIPKSSEIYHAYSFCIDPVTVNHDNQTVEIHMRVPMEFVRRRMGKNDGEKWLLDEIYSRAIKMHQERIYCSKFWKSRLRIDKIWFRIQFYNFTTEEGMLNDDDLELPKPITFTLEDDHYPNTPLDIFQMCEGLNFSDGKPMDGANFYSKLK